jgi:ABC-type branched-subunit amino acid transport system substrate-binding protein
MKKTKVFSILALVVFTALSLLFTSACRKEEPAKNQLIKVGVILPLTGNLSWLGQPEDFTLNYFSKNKMKVPNIEFIVEDSRGEPKTGVNAANKLLSTDKIDILITSTTIVSYAVSPLTETNKIPNFVLSMDPTIPEEYNSVFRIFDNVRQESKILCDYIIENKDKFKTKKVAAIYIKVPELEKSILNFISPTLEKNGFEIGLTESYTFATTIFDNIAAKIQNYSPDIIIIMGFGNTYPGLIKSLHSYELLKKTQIFGGLGFLEVPLDFSREYLEGITFVAPKFVVKSKNSVFDEKFVGEFEKKFNRHVTFDAGYIYDTLILIEAFINDMVKEKKDIDLNNLKEFYSRIGEFNGFTGKISLLKNGDANVELELVKYKNGNIETTN